MTPARYESGRPCRNGHIGVRYLRSNECVECHHAAQARWRKSNVDKVRAAGRKFREGNVEAERERARGWAKRNPERNRAKVARWRARHPERSRACVKRYRDSDKAAHLKRYRAWAKANPAAIAASVKRYRAKWPEAAKAFRNIRRARAQGAGGRGVSVAEWRGIIISQCGRCSYCGQSSTLTMDHVVPLSAGGAHDVSNVVGACSRCNSRKGARSAAAFRQLLASEAEVAL